LPVVVVEVLALALVLAEELLDELPHAANMTLASIARMTVATMGMRLRLGLLLLMI
jgi:hypothetical protein